MTLLNYNPRLRNVQDRSFTNLLDKFFNDSVSNLNEGSINFNPQVDIAETKTEFQIELSVPGMKKEDFSIDMKKDQLIISGERKRIEKQEEKNYHAIESSYGKFNRSFFLPENIQSDKIEASYTDGILNIRIPKDEKKAIEKTIQIK